MKSPKTKIRFNRWLLGPLFVLIPIWICLAWMIYDETANPRLLDGRVDDAPRVASLLLGLFTVMLYSTWLAAVWLFRRMKGGTPPQTSVSLPVSNLSSVPGADDL